uniref:Uncharacterized protein n=1 Tax=Setaria viridis TaxID=4556 RepID=A0A4U6T0D1_SETVI|nr:hypothetical protein SEVIR_9G212150v2 [Setaria viridis]
MVCAGWCSLVNGYWNRAISLTLYAECMNPDPCAPRNSTMPTFWRAEMLLQLIVVSHCPVSAHCSSLNSGS